MDLFPPISSSAFDLERRRLESTIDQDLSTISLSSLSSGLSHRQGSGALLGDNTDPVIPTDHNDGDETFLSGSMTDMTLEYPRAFGESIAHDQRRHDDWFPGPDHPPQHHHRHHHVSKEGPTGTPRASAHNHRNASGMSSVKSMAESPVSTAGHHVSAISLADGVFRRRTGQGGGAWSDDEGSEFDPERSLGRLVGELGRVMGGHKGKISPRPASPFSHALSPPRSPSPLPSQSNNGSHNNFNLSYTLTRANPLPSPPYSGGSASGSGGENNTTITNPHRPPSKNNKSASASASASTFTHAARQLQEDIRGLGAIPDNLPKPLQPRRALSDSTAHNIQQSHAGQFTPGPAAKSSKARARVAALQEQTENQAPGGKRKVQSAPVRRGVDVSADVTGMTGLMATPARGGEFETLGKNGDVGGDAGASIPQTLATLHARLRGLETENSLARRRVRELEGELERAKGEVEEAKREGGDRLKEAIGQKSALEDLVTTLRSHLTRLTHDLEESKALVTQLKSSQPPLTHPPSPPRPGTANELAALRREIERLSGEVGRLTGVVERGLETRRSARGEGTGIRVEDGTDDESPSGTPTGAQFPQKQIHSTNSAPLRSESRAQSYPSAKSHEPRLPSKLRQGLHASATSNPTIMPPSTGPATRVQAPTVPRAPPTPPPEEQEAAATLSRHSTPSSASIHDSYSSKSTRSKSKKERKDGPDSPFPSIRAEDEAEFFAVMEEHAAAQAERDTQASVPAAPVIQAPQTQSTQAAQPSRASRAPSNNLGKLPDLPEDVLKLSKGEVPPQTVLSRVIMELEDDFAHYKAIYCELADQYKLLDAASAAAKRHVLADHLKEVIDTLEQKADQISSLYDLLHFRDRPDPSDTDSANTRRKERKVSKSVKDVMRMVRETLGEEGVRRLRAEGVVGTGSRLI